MTAGVTLLVVVAFVIPLGLLVRRQADERARLEAETTAQTLAAVVVRATAGADPGLDLTDLEGLIGPIPEGSVIELPGGGQIGPGDADLGLVDEVRSSRTALSAYNTDGFGVAVPIATPGGTAIVYSSVPEEALDRGVARAWGLLGLLGAGLVAAALMISDRLGRSVVGPSQRIAVASEALGQGDLDVRVAEEGPEELQAIAQSFNRLGRRIRELLDNEREQVADLSHRLRTPLSALRLHVEQLEGEERAVLLERVDRVVAAVDDLIDEARADPMDRRGAVDIIEVIDGRARFWKVLADEQGRMFHLDLPDGPVYVDVGESETSAALDSLIGNVFAHTDSGIDFGIISRREGDWVEVEVADSGPGFPDGLDPLERGRSGAGSSGLGLDIARRFAEHAGGTLRVGSSHSGGARVVISVPVLETENEGPSQRGPHSSGS